MDTITHTVLGACMGEAIAGRRLGKKAMLIGAVANNIPDIDIIANIWATQASNLLIHRGISHSILLSVLLSMLLALIFKKVSKEEMSYKRWLLLFGSGLAIHIFIDAYTTYGTGWFEPFSHVRVSFNALFIIDPIFSLPLFISTIILLVLKKSTVYRTKWAIVGLSISLLYLITISFNKIFVARIVEKNLAACHIPYTDYMVTPTPLNNFLWYVVARTERNYYTGYYSIFDGQAPISFEKVAQNDSLLVPFKDSEEVHDLIRFSKGYYSVNKQDKDIVFSDIRFGQIEGWNKTNAPFVFNFKLQQNGNTIALQRGRFKSINSNVLVELWERIKGKK